MNNVQEIMKMVDHSLLSPTLSDDALIEGCLVAAKYHTASVCVKPYHVKLAVKCLRDSDVAVGAVIGFPHGNSTVQIKSAEADQVIEDGASEVDMVVNIGKVRSEDWSYLTEEISAIHKITQEAHAILKIIFENDLLPEEQQKIKLCKICSEVGVEFVKTSTGYNYVKGSDGKYNYKGATIADLKLMLKYTSPEVKVKAAGNSGDLATVLQLRDLGVARTGTGQTIKLYEDAAQYFNERLPDL
jgi:deoxyribose-phosphate aldolase